MSDFVSELLDLEALPGRIADLARKFRDADVLPEKDDINAIFKDVLGVDLPLTEDEPQMLPFVVVCLTALEAANNCKGEVFTQLAAFVAELHKRAGL